ncbi:hypothetical protein A2Y83_01995, partial [Candidatus Falkowbacteria bacterium RBG_13_39_14]
GAFFNKFYLWKIIAAAIITLLSIGFTYYPAIIYFKIYLTFLSLITIFLFFEAVLYLKRTLTKTAKIPVFTKKALLITVIAGLITFSLLAISYSVAAETRQCLPAQADLVSTKWDCLLEQTKIFIPLSLLILICIPLLTAIANLLIYPFSYILKERRIKKASRLMQSFDGTVIGIAGSYGKSSVKEYCAGLLGQKFEVIKTPKNVNTEIGVANYIMQKLRIMNELRNDKINKLGKNEKKKLEIRNWKLEKTQETEKLRENYLVCEMGAYRIGEIKKLCNMVKPRIGILTGINEQHIALFGNIENTIKAKSELIQSLPKGGVAIINNDDKNCRSVSIPEGVKKITYGFNFDSDVQLLEIRNLKFPPEALCPPLAGDQPACAGRPLAEEIWGMEIVIKFDNIQKTMCLNSFGKHNALNILPAIAAAKEAGMSLDEIKKTVENLEPPENGMKIKTLGKAVIIDDTYNSNPTGVRAALEVLDGVNKPNKILVLDDIWELGKESERIHRELAKIISEKKYNKIILTGKNYAEFMKNELIKNGISRDNIAAEIILSGYITIDSAILFEGRMSKKYVKRIFTNP